MVEDLIEFLHGLFLLGQMAIALGGSEGGVEVRGVGPKMGFELVHGGLDLWQIGNSGKSSNELTQAFALGLGSIQSLVEDLDRFIGLLQMLIALGGGDRSLGIGGIGPDQ